MKQDKLSFALTVMYLTMTHSTLNAAPTGFNAILSKPGVIVYKKDGYPDYVQVIKLNEGAKIKLMRGDIASPGIGDGNYGGNNPLISRQSLSTAWRNFKASDPNATCIINGQFFALAANPTNLAFPVFINGEKIAGYGQENFPGKKKKLNISSDYASITDFTDSLSELLTNSIVGLTEDAPITPPTTSTGRTFIGVLDSNHDGYDETVIIFTSKYAKPSDAAGVLREFGARDVIMLDGGASTQLTCNGTGYITSTRILPQTIGVISGSLTPSTPSSVGATDGIFSDKVLIGWSSVANTNFYKIFRCTSSDSSSCNTSFTSYGTSYSDTGGYPGVVYYYRVQACNNNGCSSYSSYNTGYKSNSSTVSLTLNGTAISGNISTPGEFDWYSFTAPSSGNYTIETWPSSLQDNYMELYGPNSRATLAGYDDDSGTGTAAKIVKYLTQGVYYVKIKAYSSSGTGSYFISVVKQ